MISDDSELTSQMSKFGTTGTASAERELFADDLPRSEATERFPDYPHYQCCERSVNGRLNDAVLVPAHAGRSAWF